MKTEEITITLSQLKLIGEIYTHAMREIDADCASVKLIDEFITRVEEFMKCQ